MRTRLRIYCSYETSYINLNIKLYQYMLLYSYIIYLFGIRCVACVGTQFNNNHTLRVRPAKATFARLNRLTCLDFFLRFS